jgi:hypothetical protein
MTDTKLIAEARKAAPLYGNDWGALLIKLADRLEQLGKVPADTAELIARAETWPDDTPWGIFIRDMKVALAAQAQEIARETGRAEVIFETLGEARDEIAAQAQEIERLKGEHLDTEDDLIKRAEAAEACVWELERKIEAQEMAMDSARRIWERKIAAIEAATIERCVRVTESYPIEHKFVCDRFAAAIRALAKEPAATPPATR